MNDGGERGPDVEELVAELRRDAVRWREALSGEAGESGGHDGEPRGGWHAEAEDPSRDRDWHARAEELRRLADPRSATLVSHRGWLGGGVLALKRVLIRLLTPIWERQTSFQQDLVAAVDSMATTLGKRAQALERRWEALDRRLVALEDAVARGHGVASLEEPGFDYERFEERFRGDAERVRAGQRRYLEHLPEPACGPVLELGCGPGIFLDLLRERGIEARGVDRSSGAVARCRAAGLDAVEGDLLAVLEACPDGSLGGVVSFQVLEHLSLPVLLRLLRVSRRKLRPGGLFLAETINVASLIVFARAWTIDPTHRQWLHPLTLRFLVEQAGYSDAELVFGGEVEPETRLVPPAGDDVGARNAAVLNETVFGPQDYAVLARA